MTRNQLEYMKLKEQERANRAQEGLTTARDAVNAEVARGTLSESKRHNLAAETELNRHQLSVEGETQRHNRVVESQSMLDLGIRADSQRETVRHNQAVEEETARHNVAGESIDSGRVAETIRHNVATERLEQGKLSETQRHNVASETVERDRAASYAQQTAASARSSIAQANYTTAQQSYLPTTVMNQSKQANAAVINASASQERNALDYEAKQTATTANLFSSLFSGVTKLAVGAAR